MNVSENYEEIVKRLAVFNYPSEETRLLGCLIISQTESQYKNYLLNALLNLDDLPVKKLINDWQNGDLKVEEEKFKFLLTDKEWSILKEKGIEDHLEDLEKTFPQLFNDGISTTFYPTKKKGMLYLRRLIIRNFKNLQEFTDLQRLILFFIAAQLSAFAEDHGRKTVDEYSSSASADFAPPKAEKIPRALARGASLISWESSCIYLGMMVSNNWTIKKMSDWFTLVWPIYTR